jgi:hypothetical protein
MVEVCRFEVCGVLVLVYVLTPHVLSEWMVEVCGAYLWGVVLAFELVDGYLGFEIRCLTCGVILYITIIHYYTLLLLYIIHYYYYILYLILYSSLLLLSQPFFSSSSSLFPIFILYLSVLTYTYLYSLLLPIFPDKISINIKGNTSIYLVVKGIHLSIFRLREYTSIFSSFYTCRYLHILIYILPAPNI